MTPTRTIAAVEINDAALTLADAGTVLASSPGFASISREPPVVGEAAQNTSRQEPLNTNNRFWSELDQQPLAQAAAGGRSRADLAWLHLKHVLEKVQPAPEGLICAVPASMRAPQLAVLAGVVGESGVALEGMIDTAVAVASAWSGNGRFVYLDLHLHHALMSAVQVEDEARLERSEIKRGAGLLALHEAWARLIARRFVTQTRFDPMHRAANEQALFAAMPGWIEQLGVQPTADIELPFGNEKLRVQISREELQVEAAPVYSGIVLGLRRLRRTGHPVTVGINESTARLPGLVERLAQIHDCRVVVFEDGSGAMAAAAQASAFSAPLTPAAPAHPAPAALVHPYTSPSPRERGEGVDSASSATLLRAAPRLKQTNIKQRDLAVTHLAQKSTPPTHVLYRGQAHMLGAEPLIVGLGTAQAGSQSSAQSVNPPGSAGIGIRIVESTAGISRLHCSVLRGNAAAEVVDFSRYGTFINDERISGRVPVYAGDRLRIGSPGVTLEFIAME